jgi:hypothetical protein
MLHPDRLRFFGSPAPYIAAAVFLILISPHVVWLVERDFPTFRWAQRFTNAGVDYWESINYLRHHASLIAIPLLAAAMALVPWRLRPAGEAFVPKAGGLILAIASVLVLAPPLLAILLHVNLKREWGDPFFFLVPIALLVLMPRLIVTRRVITRVAVLAVTANLLYLCAAPVYALVMIHERPDRNVYVPTSELALEVTRLWHERYGTPLPIVVSAFEIAAPVVFYSPDHPRMFADSPDLPRVFAADQPEFSPWIDYPADLRRYGFVGICLEHDSVCLDYLLRLDPNVETVRLKLAREVAGFQAQPWTFTIGIARPQNLPPG